MGLYIYVSNEDRITKRIVTDAYVNEEFQAALKYDSSLMIEQYTMRKKKRFFKYEDETLFNLYHETPACDGTAYQAILQMTASGRKEGVIAYLHGIVNGAIANELKYNYSKNKNG